MLLLPGQAGKAYELSKKEHSFLEAGGELGRKVISLSLYTLLIHAEVFGLFWMDSKCAVEDWNCGCG